MKISQLNNRKVWHKIFNLVSRGLDFVMFYRTGSRHRPHLSTSSGPNRIARHQTHSHNNITIVCLSVLTWNYKIRTISFSLGLKLVIQIITRYCCLNFKDNFLCRCKFQFSCWWLIRIERNFIITRVYFYAVHQKVSSRPGVHSCDLIVLKL